MTPYELLDRPIAFHRCLVEPCGSINAALMLSQAIYWSKRVPPERDGWFYKTREEWREETGLTRNEQETARKQLKMNGLLEEKLVGVPAQMHYKILETNLIIILFGKGNEGSANKLAGNQPTGRRETSQQDGTNPTNYSTEITSESTSKSTSLSPTPLSEKNGKKNGEPLPQNFNNLKELLAIAYRRKLSLIWPRDEEALLLDVCQSPDCIDQFYELMAFRAKNPQYPAFPSSVESLLRGWMKTLDRARQPVNQPQIKIKNKNAIWSE